MKRQLKELKLLFRCLFANRISRTLIAFSIITFLIGEGNSHFTVGKNIAGNLIHLVTVLIFLIVAIVGGMFAYQFANSSRRMYKRAMDSLVRYRNLAQTNTYCAKVGVNLALKDYLRKHPEYEEEIRTRAFEHQIFDFFEVFMGNAVFVEFEEED